MIFSVWGKGDPNTGYVVPGTQRKSMRGVTATAQGPDSDILSKLSGMRALSRDAAMNSPLAISIYRRHRMETVGPGLTVQARVKAAQVGRAANDPAVAAWEEAAEALFDLWGATPFCDFKRRLNWAEMQGVVFSTMLLSGDCFFMMPWREAPCDFPFRSTVHLIDADLVRDPVDVGDRDIAGGVECDASGAVVAYHVWNTYPDENPLLANKTAKCTRVPVYDAEGRQQIWHVFDTERLDQRRGVPLLAPVADALKQLTRLADAELMNALVSAFFTVFVRDNSALQATLESGVPPSMQVDADKDDPDDLGSLEMGYGNVHYLGDRDIEIADPRKTDADFAGFWNLLASTVCGAGNMPVEKANMKYTTSYTAARAAANDVWKATVGYRRLLERRFFSVVYGEVLREAMLRSMLPINGAFDSWQAFDAWSNCVWIGMGQGHLDPLKEAKASRVNINSFLSTYEEEYMRTTGGRWEAAMQQRKNENELIKSQGLNEELVKDQNVFETDEEQEEGRDT